MLNRRHFLGTIPLSAVALAPLHTSAEEVNSQPTDAPLLAGPPVVQHPRRNGFTVSVAVSRLATGCVEWGMAPDKLEHQSVASWCGLIDASDRSLVIEVESPEPLPPGKPIFYRVVAQGLTYGNAYNLERQPPEVGATIELRLPSPSAKKLTIAMVNDTHENRDTLTSLHAMLERLQPDLLVWNGDTCNDFDAPDEPSRITLAPLGFQAVGWASRWPLVFVPGNHDVRGSRARELARCLPGAPGSRKLPYSRVSRWGPLAMATLDTGEDKPDAHWVFAGMAAYEPYRRRQAKWLATALTRRRVAEAPHLITFCHIPLRGIPGEPVGLELDHNNGGSSCGHGKQLWMPTLAEHKCQMILSGHRHKHRVDDPTAEEPVMQVVAGGPQPKYATLTLLEATAERLVMRMTDLAGAELHRRELGAARA